QHADAGAEVAAVHRDDQLDDADEQGPSRRAVAVLAASPAGDRLAEGEDDRGKRQQPGDDVLEGLRRGVEPQEDITSGPAGEAAESCGFQAYRGPGRGPNQR